MVKKHLYINISVIFCFIIAFFGMVLGVLYNLNDLKVGLLTNFTIEDTLENGMGKTARVILLAGQSNAAGYSEDQCLIDNVSKEQYREYENGYDNVYINLQVSGKSNVSKGFVTAKVRQGEGNYCFGPELGIADKLNEVYPDDTFFIIKYAWSGTALYNSWLSPSSGKATGSLYESFVRFIGASVRYLEYKDYNVQIEGLCWMQGESDSVDTEKAYNYRNYLSNFVKDIRNEFQDYASERGIKFVDAYISDSPLWTHYELLNESKKAVAGMSDLNVCIDTISYGLRYDVEPAWNPDLAHYDSLSELKLGHLFVEYLYLE